MMENNQSVTKKSRLHKNNIEDVVRIISGCPNMPSRYYLPLRHDTVAKYLFQARIKKNNTGATFIKIIVSKNSCANSTNMYISATFQLELLKKTTSCADMEPQ